MVLLVLLIQYDFVDFMDLLNDNTRRRELLIVKLLLHSVINLITVIQKELRQQTVFIRG